MAEGEVLQMLQMLVLQMLVLQLVPHLEALGELVQIWISQLVGVVEVIVAAVRMVF